MNESNNPEQQNEGLTFEQIAIMENKSPEEEEEIYWEIMRAQET